MRLILVAVVCAAALPAGMQSPAERAIAIASEAITKNPGDPQQHNALAMALSRRARETADGSYYDRAAESVARTLELSPGNFEAMKTRAWILLGRHQFAAALELAKELNRRTPDDVMVYGLLTDAHTELGNYKEAEEAAQWMLNIGRSSIPGITRAAFLRELFGDIEGALELMNNAWMRIDPNETEDRAWTLTQIAHLLTLTNRLKEADTALAEALRLVPEYHYALTGLARLRSAEGSHDDAVQLLKRRYEQAPHPENLFDLAAALHASGDRAEARRAFRRFEQLALSESTGWDNANRELVRYYADYANNPRAALRIAELEVKRRRDIHTLDAYAWALHRNGRHADARTQIDAALAVGTVEPRIVFHAGAIALAQKDSAAAREYLRRALRISETSEVAADARRLLRRLPDRH